MAWNDAITAGTKWSAATFLNTILDAINEREEVVGLGGALPLAAVAAGDDVSDATWLASLQNAVDALVPYFVTTHALAGGVWGAITSFNGVNIDLGMPTWTVANAHQCVSGADSWTRKYPRRFLDLDATEYLDTAAFADGHQARCLADGKVYLRSSGAWVEMANPFGQAPSVVTTSGVIQAGDYIGSWIWSELRDTLNLLLWRAVAATFVDEGANQREGSSTGDSDPWASHTAEAEADYTTASLSGTVTPRGYTVKSEDEDEYRYAWVVRAKAKMTATVAGVLLALDSATDFYANIAAEGVFDAQGDGVVENAYKLQSLAASGDGTRTSTTYLGDTATDNPPTAWGADPAPFNNSFKGWSAESTGYALLKYDGAGGFTYQP